MDTLKKHTNEEKLTMGDACECKPHLLIQYFSFAHLPPPLKTISRPFHDLAKNLDTDLCHSYEKTVALQKLLEAKDSAVRGALLF